MNIQVTEHIKSRKIFQPGFMLDLELREGLEQRAADTQTPVAVLIRQFIRQGLQQERVSA